MDTTKLNFMQKDPRNLFLKTVFLSRLRSMAGD